MFSTVISLFLLQANAAASNDDAELALEIVEVRSAPSQVRSASISGISELDAEQIRLEAATHPNELLDRVPGAWISRGSGQEHLTAIRSPVLTGPGACGAFMLMEDHVPVRPVGFCNVNGLFEVNLLQAARVDVVRGPGSVIYGSNALHGVVDTQTISPKNSSGMVGGLSIGTDDYYRGQFSASTENLAISANYTDSGSFRDDEGYTHALANASWETSALGADVRTTFAYADLDQDTAGFIRGKDAYRDPVVRTSNPNPEAYRKADAIRLTSRWSWAPSSTELFEFTPYLRTSDMEFLQHFLPGKPLETNGQDSAGALFNWQPNENWSLGVDLEWADGFLVEFQENPTEGSAFLMETRPQGFHYDYSVTQLMTAVWTQYQHDFGSDWRLTAGARYEWLEYDYTNHMLTGNTRDDGTECGFGGCLYTRPASRSDDFSNLSPELGLSWAVTESNTLFARLARGFRAPQATELYRLQRGQLVADLESETLDTFELGIRGQRRSLAYEATLYTMSKDNFIFRDANGFNVSNGKTDHAGVEAGIDWQVADAWRLSGNLSWANHEYAFDRPASNIQSGNKVDTAPEWLGGLRLGYTPGQTWQGELEWVYTDGYFLEPGNEHRYEGHDLLNLKVVFTLPDPAHQLNVRITNLLDDYYAERADFAFGSYRYFPGAGRRFFVEWVYRSQ